MKVFVTGALGFIGRTLLERYRSTGAEVCGLDRAADAGLGVVAGDVGDPTSWRDRLRGCDVVFHTAAVVSNVASEDAFWQVNVLGTRRVLAAAAAGVGRFVHLSSVAAFGFDFPDGVDEQYPLRTNGNHYVDTKVAAEQVVLQAHAAGEIACSIVRPTDVYGPGSRPWTLLPVEMIRSGQFLLPERGRGIFSPVYVDNLIDGLEAIGSRAEASGQVFILGDGAGVTTAEYFGHYARMLGRETEISGETMRMLARRGTYSIAKARRVLGYEPKVDLAEGIQRTERWLAERGLLQ